MSRYQAILFDFDGVLADTEPVHFACWRAVLAPFSIGFDWDLYQQHCIGITDRALVEFLAARASRSAEIETLWAQYGPKKRLFRERMLAAPPISREVIDFVRSLGEYKLAVVTSSSASEVPPVLERAGLAPCFLSVICGEDVARHKPAPDAFLLAAERLGARRALVVEDSPAGLEAGRAAGFDVLHIPEARRMPELVRAALALV